MDSHRTNGRVLIMTLCLFLVSYGSTSEVCDSLNDDFSFDTFTRYLSSVVRVVSPHRNSTDTPDCLCRRSLCSTPQYALYGDFGNDTDDDEYLANTTVILESGVHVLNEVLMIESASHVALIGVEGAEMRCAGCDTTSTNGTECSASSIGVINSTFIYFYGITFEGCGVNHLANIFVVHSENVVFHNCVFRNSVSGAVHVFHTKSIAFHSCLFDSNNQVTNSANFSDLFDTHIDQNTVFFLDSRPTAGGLSIFAHEDPLKVLITETRFTGNSARPNDDQSYARTVLSFGHGGAMFIRLVGTSGSQVCIQNTEFTENSAEVNGGALQVSAADYSSNNTVEIQNCSFTKNRCSLPICTGGAIGIDYFDSSHYNLIHVSNSSFRNNSGGGGGGVALLTSVGTTPEEDQGKPLWFRDCLFEHNVASNDGSVLSFYSITQTNELGYPAFIENCHFMNNIALDVTKLTAAVSVFRVTIVFLGTNVFHNNFGGGLTLTESRANIEGSVAFHHNFAYNGGGISMYGRCLVEIYNNSELQFHNNYALKRGGGMYVEYVSADFIISILNRGCFMQYASETDTPPNKWNSVILFANNTAGEAGAGIYASDMSRCMWYGPDYLNAEQQPFFVPVGNGYESPFQFDNNIVANFDLTDITEAALATDAVNMTVTPQYTQADIKYSYSETVNFYLSTYDQFKNVREALWQVAALGDEELGALSVNNSLYFYSIPDKQIITNFTDNVNDSDISLHFTVSNVAAEVNTVTVDLPVSQCHPGYIFDGSSCTCDTSRREIVRCDNQQRYFYVQEGLWVGSGADNSLTFEPAIPGFLTCDSEGNLPGCLYKYDNENAQCRDGREGLLCSSCREGFGLSFDLLTCRSDCSSWGGVVAYLVVCIMVVILSLLALYFDVRISNKLKSLIFYGQVIKVIYRNSQYIFTDESTRGRILDFLVNLPGTSLPFPVCFHENISGYAIAWLGIVPPSLALGTALIYLFLTQRSNIFQRQRKHKSYGLHGFHLIILFIYKYFLDAAFTFIDTRQVTGKNIFSYSGESGTSAIAVTTFVIGVLLVILLGIVAPIMILIYIYRPLQGKRHFVDAFTRGLKEDKKYLWYSVWDIWRRLPFVAINLFISFTTVSVIVLFQLILALFILAVHCITKPYVRDFINLIEAFILFCLFGTTLAILDENDIYIQRNIAITFILLPFGYGLMYAVFLITKIVFRKFLKKELDLSKIYNKTVDIVSSKFRMAPESETQSQHTDEVETDSERNTGRSLPGATDCGDDGGWKASRIRRRESLLNESYVHVNNN